jgi:hypothetical protein
MRIVFLLLVILAAVGCFYFYNQHPLPPIPTIPEVTPKNSTTKVEEVPQDISPAQPIAPIIETLDESWFVRQITDTSQACLLALSSEQTEFQEIQTQISSLRNAANKSRTLSTHLDLRAGILRLFGRLSFAYNELLQYRKRYKDIDTQKPTALDAYKISIDEWREQRKKRAEVEWFNRKKTIETEIGNLTKDLLLRSKEKNLNFDTKDLFVIAAQNIKNTAEKIKSAHEQAEAAREIAKQSKFHDIEVTQVLPKGILADPLKSVNRSSSLTRVGGGGAGIYSYHLSGRIVYIDGFFGMAEGQRALVSYVEDGVFTFVDVSGASRTVPKWKYIRTEEKHK